jgi:4-hydroxy-3-methylbut-2-enyl diphosphate reductase IspH
MTFTLAQLGNSIMEVLLADEFGFCFGVERAVEMVEDGL